VWLSGLAPTASNPDLETGMRVASKVENVRSKFEHATPLGSQIIRYVRDGQTDGRTKATLIAPGRGLNKLFVQCHGIRRYITKSQPIFLNVHFL